MAARTSKEKSGPVEFRLKSPDGNEYTVSTATEYYDLKARGYADVDPGATAKAVAHVEDASTRQVAGPAEGAGQADGAGK